MENTQLYHHGTKGQKWGIRRYQNSDGSLTEAGRKRYQNSDGSLTDKGTRRFKNQDGTLTKKGQKAYKGDKDFKKQIDKENRLKKAAEARAAKKKQEEETKKKQEEEAKKAQEYEEAKQQAIKTGSATEVLKYKGELTQQEMSYIQSRIQWEQNMKNVSDKETAAGKTKTEEFFDKVNTATTYALKGARAYNMAANVINAFNGEKVLPKIETNIASGNKQDVVNRQRQKDAIYQQKVKSQQEAAAKKQQQQNEEKQSKKDKKAEEKAAKKEKKSKEDNDGRTVYTGTMEDFGPAMRQTISNLPSVSSNTGRTFALAVIEEMVDAVR